MGNQMEKQNKTGAPSVRVKARESGVNALPLYIRPHWAQVWLIKLMRILHHDPDPAKRQRETSKRQGHLVERRGRHRSEVIHHTPISTDQNKTESNKENVFSTLESWKITLLLSNVSCLFRWIAPSPHHQQLCVSILVEPTWSLSLFWSSSVHLLNATSVKTSGDHYTLLL